MKGSILSIRLVLMNSKQRRKIARTATQYLPVVAKVVKDHIKGWEHPDVTKEQVLKELREFLSIK